MIINYEEHRRTFSSDIMMKLGRLQVQRGVKVLFVFQDLTFGLNRLRMYFPKALMEISKSGVRVWERKE